MVPTLMLAALFAFGGLFTYTLAEQRHRGRWSVSRPGGTLLRARAPRLIRRTALWSIYMGQMAVPGSLLGLFGLFAAGIGLVSVPGLILAVRIWRLGFMLLRRDPKAEQEARSLETFAIVLNAIGFVVALVLPFFGGEGMAVAMLISLTLIVYGAISIAHAYAMRRCAELLASERLDQARPEPSPAPHAGPGLGHGWTA